MSKKTNAMRLLDQNKLPYEVLTYDLKDGQIDGISVAKKIDKPLEEVFKTLVLTSGKDYYVAMIPVEKNLSLKAVAKHFGEKKVEMIQVKDIQKITGYIRGGCSPLGMKKQFKTVIDDTVDQLNSFVFSAGKKGVQICMSPNDFKHAIDVSIKKVVE